MVVFYPNRFKFLKIISTRIFWAKSSLLCAVDDPSGHQVAGLDTGELADRHIPVKLSARGAARGRRHGGDDVAGVTHLSVTVAAFRPSVFGVKNM
jgi:hypothetical protein